MSEHTRTRPVRAFTIKQGNSDFVDTYSQHREMSRGHLLDEIIEFYRERYDPTYTSRRRLTAPNRYGAGM